MTESFKILVVANPGEQSELVSLLRTAGSPLAEARTITGDGDDVTLARFVREQPTIAVVAATLDSGDAGALVAAMRGRAAGRLFVVLVGDLHGPVLNALDAIEAGADRFVGRPLSVKALRFAVMGGISTEAASAMGSWQSAPRSSVQALADVAMLARPAADDAVGPEATPIAVDDSVVTTPTRVAELRARWEALAEEIDEIPDDELDDRPTLRNLRAVTAPMATVTEDDLAVAGDGSSPVPAEIFDQDSGPELIFDSDPPELVVVQETASVAAIPDDEAWPPPELSERIAAIPPRPGPALSELLTREPTMILTDEPPGLSPSGPAPMSASSPSSPLAMVAAARVPRSVTIPPSPVRPTQPQAPSRDDDLGFDDDFADDADLGAADGGSAGGFGSAGSFGPDPQEPGSDSGPIAVVARPAEPPPAGGEFARELRRKMSAMAERLFRGEVPAAPVASGPGHDHHTEIDLGGLDEETPLPAAALTDDLGGATYVGELPSPELVAAPSGTDGRGTAEVGELRRGAADVPSLVARVFAQTLTGRLVFRRGPIEKAIYFDGGRPVFATSNQLHDRMGELLLREGKITREQHERCRDLVRDSGRRMGEILVERGYLKRRELLPAVRRHVEDIIYSLFAWDGGEYRMEAGDGAGNERIRLSRHAAAIILEGVRRKLDHDLLEQLLGPPGTVVIILDRDKLAAVTAVADLSREERAALTALDGIADLDQVARSSGAGLEAVYQLAWSLSLLGLVAPRRRNDEDGEAGALVGESDLRIDRERVAARCALCADADYFTLLGVRADATGFEIRRAYEAARRDYAVESFPPELRRELAPDLDDIALVLDEAFRVLREDPLRTAYRSHLLELESDVA